MAYQSPQLTELLEKHNALEKQLAEARAKEVRLAMIEIVHKMREYGITLHELVGRKTTPNPVQAEPAPKYRDPVTGATWSGRGRAPHWIVGKNRDDFIVSAHTHSRATALSQASLFSEDV
jgi:DNA-binding protein H-NS